MNGWNVRLAGIAVHIGVRVPMEAAILLAAATWWCRSAGPVLAVGVALLVVVLVMLSTLGHEAGHAITARALGLTVFAVEIRGFAEAVVRRGRARDPGTDVAICLAGPAVNAGLAALGAAGLLLPLGFAAGRAATALLACNMLALAGAAPIAARSDGRRAWRAWRARPRPPR